MLAPRRNDLTKKRIAQLLIISMLFVVPKEAQAQKKLTAAEASGHVGEHGTVCGMVVSTRYATGSRGAPTFLNLDEPFPKQIFTIVIWGSDRSKFGDPESRYAHQKVCVTGLIKSYRGVPEVEANEPGQIETQM
jgi:DNA/RNA endonuclease YhcR with UshA esterase domain